MIIRDFILIHEVVSLGPSSGFLTNLKLPLLKKSAE